MSEYCIVTFSNTHMALRAETVAKRAGLPIKMIPVPRELSADCNMGMRSSVGGEAALKALLVEKGIECVFVRWQKK